MTDMAHNPMVAITNEHSIGTHIVEQLANGDVVITNRTDNPEDATELARLTRDEMIQITTYLAADLTK